MLDADEIPSPSIINFFNTINTDIILWELPWAHLWKDEQHYRIDINSITKWDPFNGGQRKGFIVKNVPGLKYDIKQHRVRPSNQPINCPKPHSTTDEVIIVHYGRISEYYLKRESHKERAMWDEFEKKSNYNKTLQHHIKCEMLETVKLKDIPFEWKWDADYIVNEIKRKGYYVMYNTYNNNFCDDIVNSVKNIKKYEKGEGNDIRVLNYEKYHKNAMKFLKNSFFKLIGEKLLQGKIDVKSRCQLGIVKKEDYNSGGGVACRS